MSCECVGLIDWAKQRGQLRNPDNASWFTIFAVCTSCRLAHALLTVIHTCTVFEIVSAYGTVGLSLGVPSVESISVSHPPRPRLT
jgi:Trk-type K+ transport system membrane component